MMNGFMQRFKTTVLLSGLTALFMAVGYALTGGSKTGMLIGLGIAAVTNIGMYWFSSSLVLKMQGAKPLAKDTHSDIYAIVRELTTADALPMPKLYLVDTPVPNAFATGRSPKHAAVAVTSGILALLSRDELKAVLGHELGHVKNRDMLVSTMAATIAGAISFVVDMAFWSSLFGGGDDEESSNPLASLAALLLAPIAAILIQMAISRSREYLADQHGAHLVGSGEDLANALRKLESFKQQVPPLEPSSTQQASAHLMFANMFSMGGLASLFSTHPSTQQRIARLQRVR